MTSAVWKGRTLNASILALAGLRDNTSHTCYRRPWTRDDRGLGYSRDNACEPRVLLARPPGHVRAAVRRSRHVLPARGETRSIRHTCRSIYHNKFRSQSTTAGLQRDFLPYMCFMS